MPRYKPDGRLQQVTYSQAADSSDNDRCNRLIRTSTLVSVRVITLHWNLHNLGFDWGLLRCISGDPTDDQDLPKLVNQLGLS